MPLFYSTTNDKQFTANCSVSASIGDLVYINNSSSYNSIFVEKVDITDSKKMPAIGVIVSKAYDTHAVVQRFGHIDISNIVSTLSASALTFIDINSKPTTTPPISSNMSLLWQIIGVATGSGSLELKPQLLTTLVKPR